jgi:hypothetical protein
MTPVWRGKMVGGEFKPDRPDDYKKHLQHLEGKRVEQVIERRRQKRSLPQNAFYWGILLPLFAGHVGCEIDEMHATLKERFPVGAELEAYFEQERLVRLESSSQFTKEQFQFYIERIQRLAAELGLYIPDPREVTSIGAEKFHETT